MQWERGNQGWSMDNRTPDDPDILQLAAQAARGRRPEFTDDPLVGRLFGIALALTTELAVTRERLDTVERLLARRALLPRDEIETFRPEPADALERGALHQDYLARVLRVLLQDEPAAAAQAESQPVDASAAFSARGARA